MFEVGKKYKNLDKIATCMFVGNSVAVLRHDDNPKYEFTVSVNVDDWWKEYSPPVVEKFIRWAGSSAYGLGCFSVKQDKTKPVEFTITDGELTDVRIVT